MSVLKIALLQITPCKSLKENLEKGIVYCKKAKEKGAIRMLKNALTILESR